MHTSRYHHGTQRVLTGVFFLALSTLSVAAPPQALTHQDAVRYHEATTISNDFSQTRSFDLTQTLEIAAKIQGVEEPKQAGYVILLFTLDLTSEQARESQLDTRQLYRAILQTPEEIDRLDISLHDFRVGDRVTLIGWPKTESGMHSAMLLIDAVVFTDDNTRISFHDENQALRDRVNGVTEGPPEITALGL